MAGNRVIDEEGSTSKAKLTRDFLKKVRKFPVAAWRRGYEVGRQDPRRVTHALKVGLSLTLVSSLYLMEPLFRGVGENSIWAVITVVVVLEFTAGATLCKGLNRGFGTLCAASLGFLVEFVVENSGDVVRAVFIGASVFLVGATCTYLRFFPYIKKNYDYGVVIFLLTYNLITVPSYRLQNVMKVAHERLYTIGIGCGLCLIMCLLIFPNWSGEELHNSTAAKLEALAKSIDACVNGYFRDADIEAIREEASKDPAYKGYRVVLDSKSSDESLALFASWEPRHSIHCYRYPWQQYVKLGTVLRHFGYTVVSLHGCLESEIQTPYSVRVLFRDPCSKIAEKMAKVLKELASSIRARRRCSPDALSDQLHDALKALDTALKSQPRLFLGSDRAHSTNMLVAEATAAANRKQDRNSNVHLSSAKTDSSALLEWRNNKGVGAIKESEKKVLRPSLSKIAFTSLEFSEALPFAAFASLLVETVARLELVVEEVEQLGRVAGFKEYEGPHVEIQVSSQMNHTDNVVISQGTE